VGGAFGVVTACAGERLEQGCEGAAIERGKIAQSVAILKDRAHRGWGRPNPNDRVFV
jgi:hypothetical protein